MVDFNRGNLNNKQPDLQSITLALPQSFAESITDPEMYTVNMVNTAVAIKSLSGMPPMGTIKQGTPEDDAVQYGYNTADKVLITIAAVFSEDDKMLTSMVKHVDTASAPTGKSRDELLMLVGVLEGLRLVGYGAKNGLLALDENALLGLAKEVIAQQSNK